MHGSPRSYHADEFTTDRLTSAKSGRTVSVCVPARDEASTVGAVVRAVMAPHVAAAGGSGLVDEVLVVDDGSSDATAERARAAGARVVRVGGGPGGGVGASPGQADPDGPRLHDDDARRGKGRAMRVGLEAARGDIVVYLDADVENTSAQFVSGLLGPLLVDDEVTLVKGFYERPIEGAATGGGRVTELMARPLIDLLFPELAGLRQPLAGETAAHRWVLEKVPFADGYGVELGLLIDVSRRFGVASIAQVDLGRRVHRNRPLDELRPQATEILRAALSRAGWPTTEQP
jgi:glucosyl-3-phosphoglycerate synthase